MANHLFFTVRNSTNQLLSGIIIELKQHWVIENQILESISHIKNVGKKSPTAEKILNHISKTLPSNIDLSFVNETMKQLIARYKINYNFKIVEEIKNGNRSG